ncbi:unnamed protein product [Moneuplotes crassus]|uniref:Uncharacterized protein n=1 Tax=Euplotes crassus TaxID=5936 RepID=A0AAD1XZG1_EUPCR|nr:unnamed protein product [Moneuplotes crassus]
MGSKGSMKFIGLNLSGSEAKQVKEKKRFLNLLNEVKFKDVIDQAPLLNFMEDLCINWRIGFKDDKAIIDKLKSELNEEKALISKCKKLNANLKNKVSKVKRENERVESNITKLEIKRKFMEYRRQQKMIAPHKLALHHKYKKELNQIIRRCVTKTSNKEFYTSED